MNLLDSTVFPGWFQDSHVYLYKELPHPKSQNLGESIKSYLFFTVSAHLNASSIAFYYLTLILAVFMSFMHKSESKFEEQSNSRHYTITINL